MTPNEIDGKLLYALGHDSFRDLHPTTLWGWRKIQVWRGKNFEIKDSSGKPHSIDKDAFIQCFLKTLTSTSQTSDAVSAIIDSISQEPLLEFDAFVKKVREQVNTERPSSAHAAPPPKSSRESGLVLEIEAFMKKVREQLNALHLPKSSRKTKVLQLLSPKHLYRALTSRTRSRPEALSPATEEPARSRATDLSERYTSLFARYTKLKEVTNDSRFHLSINQELSSAHDLLQALVGSASPPTDDLEQACNTLSRLLDETEKHFAEALAQFDKASTHISRAMASILEIENTEALLQKIDALLHFIETTIAPIQLPFAETKQQLQTLRAVADAALAMAKQAANYLSSYTPGQKADLSALRSAQELFLTARKKTDLHPHVGQKELAFVECVETLDTLNRFHADSYGVWWFTTGIWIDPTSHKMTTGWAVRQDTSGIATALARAQKALTPYLATLSPSIGPKLITTLQYLQSAYRAAYYPEIGRATAAWIAEIQHSERAAPALATQMLPDGEQAEPVLSPLIPPAPDRATGTAAKSTPQPRQEMPITFEALQADTCLESQGNLLDLIQQATTTIPEGERNSSPLYILYVLMQQEMVIAQQKTREQFQEQVAQHLNILMTGTWFSKARLFASFPSQVRGVLSPFRPSLSQVTEELGHISHSVIDRLSKDAFEHFSKSLDIPGSTTQSG